MTGDGAWRFADVAVGSRHYSLEPQVMADYGAYVRPFPWPESHRVGVSVTVGSTTEDAVRAWRTTCLRVVHHDEAKPAPLQCDDAVLLERARAANRRRAADAGGLGERL